jgi:RimJ/RimL family protein N-acetyltransferase
VSIGQDPELISTARLDLLPIQPDYAEEMSGVLADPALYEFIGGQPPAAAELRSRYQSWVTGSPDPAQGWHNWVIRLREEGCLAGWVQATISGLSDRTAEVAWVIGKPWQGRGIASEAARGLVSWLVGAGPGGPRSTVTTVTAHIHPDHHASAAVARAAGLAPTAEMLDGEVLWRLRTGG